MFYYSFIIHYPAVEVAISVAAIDERGTNSMKALRPEEDPLQTTRIDAVTSMLNRSEKGILEQAGQSLYDGCFQYWHV